MTYLQHNLVQSQRTTARRLFVLVLLGVLSVVTMLSIAPTSYAQTAEEAVAEESITLTPTNKAIALKAGETTSGTMTVLNSGKTDFTFILYSRPYSVSNESYDPSFEKVGSNTDLYQWVTLPKTLYVLKAGEQVEVPFSVNTPAGAVPGGHYGIIFAETQPDPTAQESVVRKKRVGMIVRGNVEGEYTEKGKLVSTDAPFWQFVPPLQSSLRIENDGTTDFQAHTELTIRDIFGNEKQKIIQDSVVYPGTIRKITMSWDKAPWFGLFSVETAATIVGTTTSEKSYVLIAPKWLAIVLAVVLLGGLGYAFVRHRRR